MDLKKTRNLNLNMFKFYLESSLNFLKATMHQVKERHKFEGKKSGRAQAGMIMKKVKSRVSKQHWSSHCINI